MQAAHEKGTPVIRPLFYNYSQDEAAWSVEDEFLFGDSILVAPVLHEKSAQRDVYLPAGNSWVDAMTGAVLPGGQTISAQTPINEIPVYIRQSVAEELLPAFEALK
ncbi:hypothetical protein [Levilactobacillus spicheri]